LNINCLPRASMAAILVGWLMTFIAQTQAAEIHVGPFGHLYFEGPIFEGDAKKFDTFTAKHPAGTYVFLDGPGGAIGEMLEIGNIIQKRRFSTAVSHTGTCASACAILFFSGHHAVIQRNSAICFHMPSYAQSKQPISSQEVDELANEIVKWGLTKSQALAVLGAAPPSGIRCATERWAQILGFQYSVVSSAFGMWRSCSTKFCLALP
jgi:membrane-bound ClpP family serine protease